MSTDSARHKRRLLPGFGLTLGITLTLLSVVVLLPLTLLVLRAAEMSWEEFKVAAFSRRALSAYRVSFVTALAAAVLVTVSGTLVAWVLERYDFPGRRALDALVDLPFALPTAVAGIALTALYGPTGPIGVPLEAMGIKVAYTHIGITLALAFVGLPFVVRTVQPVLEELEPELEEAAACLGATRMQTVVRVLFPALQPALIAGFALAFARGVGEYGSVIFIAGNLPMKTEIAPLLVVIRLEEFDYQGAAAIASVMLAGSFAALALVHFASVKLRRAMEAT